MAKVKVSISQSDMESMKRDIIKEALPQILTEIANFAEKELKVAFKDADFKKNKTQNLKDSYVYGVYYKRSLQRYGFLTTSPTATEVVRKTGTSEYVRGRDEAEDFIRSHQPSSNEDFHIVFAAKIFYAAYLENGTKRHKPYTVLSSIYTDMNYSPLLKNIKITVETHKY